MTLKNSETVNNFSISLTLEVTFGTIREPQVLLVDNRGVEIVGFSRRKIINPFKRTRRQYRDLGNGDQSTIRIISSTVKTYLNNPFFLFADILFGRTIHFEIPFGDNSSLLYRVSTADGKAVWISRSALFNFLLPNNLELSLEFQRITKSKKFNLYVHDALTDFPFSSEVQSRFGWSAQQLDLESNRFCQVLFCAREYRGALIHHGTVVEADQKLCLVDLKYDEKPISRLWPYFYTLREGFAVILRGLERESIVPKGIFIGSTSNWYHFLIDILPGLIFYSETNAISSPLVLQGDVPNSIIELVKIITGLDPILIPCGESVRFNSLTVIKSREFSQIRHSEDYFMYLEIIRRVVLKKYGFEPNARPNGRKVLIRREAGLFRPLRNAFWIEKFLKFRGFEVIYPSHCTLREQIALFQESTVIVAESGAAMANLLFVNQFTKVIELQPPHSHASDLWQTISNYFCANHVILLGKRRTLGLRYFGTDGFTVPIHLLRWALPKLLQRNL
jgi:hypothetical protein